MKRKLTLPESARLYRKLLDTEDTRKFQIEEFEITKEIEKTTEQLSCADSMEDYEILTSEVEKLKKQLGVIEAKARIHPKMLKRVLNEERPKIKDLYNKEFEPHYDRYLKLQKELRKKLIGFAKATEPVVREMKEIEALELSFHGFKSRGSAVNRGQFFELPIETKTLKDYRTPFVAAKYSTSDHVAEVVRAIKRNWGDK